MRRHGVTRHLILQLSRQPARMLVQSAGGAILSFCERTLERRTPPRLRCFQVNRKLPVGGLHGRERRGYLLLNLIGRGTQRLALRSRLFSRFLERPRRRLRARNDLLFRPLGLALQPRGRFLGLPAN